jgi:hypothetical protein
VAARKDPKNFSDLGVTDTRTHPDAGIHGDRFGRYTDLVYSPLTLGRVGCGDDDINFIYELMLSLFRQL